MVGMNGLRVRRERAHRFQLAGTCGFALAALSLCFAVGAVAEVNWQVLESSERQLHVRVTLGEAQVVPVVGAPGRTPWVEILLEGASSVGTPGEPLLPRVARWMVVPPTGDLGLEVLGMRVSELGSGRVVPHPMASIDADAERGDVVGGPHLVEVHEEGATYATFRRDRGSVVTLGEPVFQRRQRMAAVRIDPLLYDAATGRIQLVREVEFLVRFPSGTTSTEELTEVDPTIAVGALNASQAAAWRTLAPALLRKRELWQSTLGDSERALSLARRVGGVQVFDAADLLADPIRIRTPRTGIVRVRVDDLISAGGLPATALRRQIRVVQLRGSSTDSPEYPSTLVAGVPLHFLDSPDEAAAVSTTDEIFFHAFSPKDDAASRLVDGDTLPAVTPHRPDHYNSDNVYFVLVTEPGSEPWERFDVGSVAPSAGTDLASQYRRRDVFGDDTGFQDDPVETTLERYHWNAFDAIDVRRSLELRHPVPGQNVNIRWFAGPYRTATSGVVLDFSLIQGTTELPLRTQSLNPSGRLFEMTGQFDSSAIGNGLATFRMNRQASGISIAVLSFLGSVELEYDALYRATSDRIEFELPTADVDYDVEIPGFSRADLLVFDVTDRYAPAAVNLGTGNVVETDDSPFLDYTVSLRVEQELGQRRRLTVAPRIRFDRIGPESIERDPIVDLFDAVDDLQVLAIGPEFLRAETQRWIDFRRERIGGRDWNFGYVDVQQIYDQFTGGLQSPHAIKSLLEWAYVNWDARAVLLVGDANEDARGVSPNAGPNLVPISLHLQTSAGSASRELLGSDKWYGIFDYVGTNFPDGLRVTSDLLIGRLPVSGVDDLRPLIDKIIAYEQPGPNDAWRNRTLWMADDAYATGFLGGTAQDCYRFKSSEVRFLTSQQLNANLVAASGDSTIEASMYSLDDFTSQCRTVTDPIECESRSQVLMCFSQNFRGELLDRLSQGWLMVSYQGHADYNVLAHEDILRESSFLTLRNEGRPFLFFGMGCHISDFLRARGSVTSVPGTSMTETMLLAPDRGAIAVYGSSGFEFLEPNAVFMEQITRSFFGAARTTSAVLGDDLRSRWVLGEALTQAELDVFALRPSFVDEMVAQYNALGDPLLRMDAAPARLEARREGAPLLEGASLVADEGAATALLALTAVDESGVARLEISDSEGRDYSSVVPPLEGPDRRRAQLELAVPIHPQRYEIEIAVFDESYPELRRTVLALEVPLEVELRADGVLIDDPAQLVLAPERRTALELDFTSPVDLTQGEVDLVQSGVDFFGEQITGSGRQWNVRLDAQPRGDEAVGALTLRLRGLDTVLGTQSDPDGGAQIAVGRHAAIPNPMRDLTNFTAEVQGPVERVRLTVYDLAGRSVFERIFDPSALVDTVNDVNGRALAFQWNGRDRRGDELANGTYLYRLEVSGLGVAGRSDMGRLVIMR